MKKLLSSYVVTVAILSVFSSGNASAVGTALAPGKSSASMPSPVTQMCTSPSNWKPEGFHYTPTYYCKNVVKIKCKLVAKSWGNPDPYDNTFHTNVDWTLSAHTKNSHVVLGNGQCISVVNGVLVHPYCRGVANGPITCAYMYAKHVANKIKPA